MCSDEANIKVEVAYGAIPDSPGRGNAVRPKNHVNTPFWGFRGYQNVPTQGKRGGHVTPMGEVLGTWKG